MNVSTQSKFATKTNKNIRNSVLDLNGKYFHKSHHYSSRETVYSLFYNIKMSKN